MKKTSFLTTGMRMFFSRWWRGLRLLLLILPLASALQACTFPVKQMYFSGFEGKVVDEETGEPIEGAVVFIHWEEEKVVFESYRVGPFFVAETVTDESGRFVLPEGGPVTAFFSRHLTTWGPNIGIIERGYGLLGTNLQHDVTYGLPNRQIFHVSERWCCTFHLKRMSLKDIMVGEGGRDATFISGNVRRIAARDCMWERIPRTIAVLDRLAREARDQGIPPAVFTIERIPQKEECRDVREYFGKQHNA